MINAFTTDPDLKKIRAGGAEAAVVAAKNESLLIKDPSLKTVFYQLYEGGEDKLISKKVCLSSLLLPDKKIDYLIEYVLSNNAAFMVEACRTLEEVGLIEARFRLSPVMLLNKLGLLANSVIVGGVYLDNDDVDLMVQENASLVLTPSFDCGCGHGIASAASYLKRGLKINIGTADNRFNKSADLKLEADFLKLLTCGTMCDPSALSDADIKRILG